MKKREPWLINRKYTFGRVLFILFFLFAISTLVTFIFTGRDLFRNFAHYRIGIIYGFLVGLTFWIGNWLIGRMNGKLKWNKNPQRANMISLLTFICFGIIASVSVPYLYYGVFLSQGNIVQTVVINGFINLTVDIIFVSVYYSKYLVYYYSKSLQRTEELKRENLIAKYEALKSQVNPHFLFNSLNTLSGVVEKSPEKAVVFIKKLSDIYRYVLEQKDKELIGICEEIRFVRDYFHLSQIRHGNALSMEISLPEQNLYIAPLGLQILVENAIKHNAINDDTPLHIEISMEIDYIVVKNNKQKKTTVRKNGSVGLTNLKNRYTYLSDKPVEVIDTNKEFIVKLPVIYSDSYEVPGN